MTSGLYVLETLISSIIVSTEEGEFFLSIFFSNSDSGALCSDNFTVKVHWGRKRECLIKRNYSGKVAHLWFDLNSYNKTKTIEMIKYFGVKRKL
jgi:hypothetical protein